MPRLSLFRPTSSARALMPLMLASTLLGGMVSPAPAAIAQGIQAQADTHTLNFRDVAIKAMIDDVAMMTGRTFIIDPSVRGQITIISSEPVTSDVVFDLFLSALRVYGYTAQPTRSGAYKIIPLEKALRDGSKAVLESRGDDVLISEIFRIEHTDPVTLLNSIKPLLDRQGFATGHRTQNYILVVDYAGNMERIRKIINEIDEDTSVVTMVTLKNSGADEMAETLRSLRSRPGDNSVDVAFTAIPVVSSNTLLLRGEPNLVREMKALALNLDARGANKGDIRVVPLRHADAEAMVPMLEQVSRSLAEAAAPGNSNSAAAAAARASISFHKETNALVISASPDMQQTLEGVIRQLDIPRAQVLVEAIIAEISDNAARDLGIQYVLSGGEGSNIPFTATNYSNSAPNILAATGALLNEDILGADTNSTLAQAAVDSLIGLSGFTAGFGGTSGGTLFGVIFNAIQSDTESNILSTPYLMTLDNQTANFLSGQEIPITTGEALGTANVNAFRTVQREEVGIKLEVTPHINQDGEIRIEIKQEVSSIFSQVGASGDIITNKRNLETTIVANDGDLIVLGGLLEENENVQVQKVPLLGDIPVLGNLFRNQNKSKTKTNLMVFLRPTIVRDGASSRAVTNRKLGVLRGTDLMRAPDGSNAVDNLLYNFTGAKPADVPPAPAPSSDDEDDN